MREALEKATSKAGEPPVIKALGITNQRETVIMWDKHTGRPLHPAIVWMDSRTAPMCKHMVEEFGAVGAVRSSLVSAARHQLLNMGSTCRVEPR